MAIHRKGSFSEMLNDNSYSEPCKENFVQWPRLLVWGPV